MLVPQNKGALLHLSQVNQWICDLKRYTIFKKTNKQIEGTPTFPSSVTPGGLSPFPLIALQFTSLCCFETGELTISVVKRHLMEMCGHIGL